MRTQHAMLKNRRSQGGVVLDTVLIQPLHEAVSSSFSEARAGSEGPSSWFPTLFYLEMSCNFRTRNPTLSPCTGPHNYIPGPERGLNVFLCMRVQLCLTLCNPIDCGLSGSSVHGILQARILESVAISSSRGSS